MSYGWRRDPKGSHDPIPILIAIASERKRNWINAIPLDASLSRRCCCILLLFSSFLLSLRPHQQQCNSKEKMSSLSTSMCLLKTLGQPMPSSRVTNHFEIDCELDHSHFFNNFLTTSSFAINSNSMLKWIGETRLTHLIWNGWFMVHLKRTHHSGDGALVIAQNGWFQHPFVPWLWWNQKNHQIQVKPQGSCTMIPSLKSFFFFLYVWSDEQRQNPRHEEASISKLLQMEKDLIVGAPTPVLPLGADQQVNNVTLIPRYDCLESPALFMVGMTKDDAFYFFNL